MILRMNSSTTVQDLRLHSPELVDELRRLLAAGAPALVDPHRKDFYEVQNHERVFYIHVRPRGRVWLIAVWPKEGACLPTEYKPALACGAAR